MIINRFYDFNFIKFPIWAPIIYFLCLHFFPSYENILILLTILLLAETHFGATWPFLLHKDNHLYIKENVFKLIFIPITIILLSLISFLLITDIFLIIFFAANIYHVTRQSAGICKFYKPKIKELNFQFFIIYFFGVIYFIIAIIRFYSNFIILDTSILTSIIVFSIVILSAIYFYLFSFNQNYFCFLTGLLIFLPVCFVKNPVHVILMGVTMHYCQYIAMTYKVNLVRELKLKKSALNFIDHIFLSKKFIFIIIFYSLLMTSLSFFTKDLFNPQLLIIPIIGQILHFYFDSQLWKFSIKHNVEYVLKPLVAKIK